MTTDRGFRWRCSACGRSYGAAEVQYTCPPCGDLGLLDGEVDYAGLLRAGPARAGIDLRQPGLWRYAPLLPAGPPAGEQAAGPVPGQTPLVESVALARQAGVRRLWIKDEGRNPSGSLKDRASWLVVAHALASGRTQICTASSGNAGVALAAAAAPTPLEVTVFVPPAIPAAKLAQLWAYGARVISVAGGYAQAVAVSRLAAELNGWYCRNTAFNPLTTEGKKTVALEIIEQLEFRSPDVIVVPTGDGNILTGVYRGLQDAMALRWLTRMPRLIAVQSAAARPIERAWARGDHAPEPMPASSQADSINVGAPADGRRAIRALTRTSGAAYAVADSELGPAIRTLASATGVFAEPASATIWPGLKAAVEAGAVSASDEVVLICTGSGLKDLSAAISAASPPAELPAGLDCQALTAAVRQLA